MGTSMFRGSDGKASMMRISTFIVVLSTMGVFIAHNVMSMIQGSCSFISLGASEAILIAGVLGIKAGQSFIEGKATNGKTEDTEIVEEVIATPKVPEDVKE